MMCEVLYLFSGEKAQGAEIVMSRLIEYNIKNVKPHLFIAPGAFASKLSRADSPVTISLVNQLKKLNRRGSSSVMHYFKALKNYLAVSYKTYHYVRKNKISVVHCNTIVPATYLLPLIILSPILLPKVIWFWSDHDLKYYTGLEYTFSKWCKALYNKTLVVSKAVEKKYGDASKVIVLYNGINLTDLEPDENIRNDLRRSLQIPDNGIVIGMPAAINPRKGQLQLIEVFNSIAASHPDIFLLLAGNYELAAPEYCNAVSEAISKNDQIIFLGFTDDMHAFYNACDIVVNNSNIVDSEPLGTSIYEAMAYKKLVVASLTGGTPEIITDQVDGFLFEAESSHALKEKLIYVIDHRYELENVKESARDTVRKKFNIDNMASQYNKLLKDCLKPGF